LEQAEGKSTIQEQVQRRSTVGGKTVHFTGGTIQIIRGSEKGEKKGNQG